MRLVEAVDFVDEQDSALIVEAQPIFSVRDGFAELGHAGADGADRFEVGAGETRDYVGQGSLPAAGWPPKNERRNAVRLNGAPQGALGPHKMLLADEFFQSSGADAGGQWSVGFLAPPAALFEKVHAAHLESPAFPSVPGRIVAPDSIVRDVEA